MKKILKITGIAIAVVVLVLVFMISFPFVFREKFKEIVRNTAKKTLKTEMNFSEMDVSFFHHFPKLTITLRDFYLFSSEPFEKDTLVRAKDISFGVNVLSVIKGPLRISSVFVGNGKVVLEYNIQGKGNLDVYNSDTTAITDTVSGSTADLKIESIEFKNSEIVYADYSIPMSISCRGINYRGNSEISQDIMKLNSKISIDDFDIIYNKTAYIDSKPVQAELSTTINLNSLDIDFNENDLRIKDVPFEFRGELNFKKNGYAFFISLYSMYKEEWISGSVYLVSTDKNWISVKTDINMDLESWTKRLGVQDAEMKGIFTMKLNAQGNLISGPDPASANGDTVILSIPDFTFSSTLKKGYFKLADLPQGLENISFSLKAASNGSDYRKITVSADSLHTSFLKNNIDGYFRLKGLEDFPVEGKIVTDVNLAELKQVIPLDSLDLSGMLHLDLSVDGKYSPVKKLFPVCRAEIDLKQGRLLTKFAPEPLEKVNLVALVTNETGTLSGTKVSIPELSFSFKGNPFSLKAELVNPDNLKYDVTSRGTIDIAGIYKMFSQEGMDLAGEIQTDLHLKGTQQDALAGRMEKLQNSGTLSLKNIAFRSDYLRDELILKSGLFRFENDKIWFEKFRSKVGKTEIILDGNLENVVNYALSEGQVLKGNFTFTSSYVDVNDFIPVTQPSSVAPEQPSSTAPGVIVVPPDLDIALKADIGKVNFEGLVLENVKGTVKIKPGTCDLEDLKFSLIDCNVALKAKYQSNSPKKALFDLNIKADEFDVHRAYNEVEMFRKLASSAEKCEGIISIDYQIKGKLVRDMEPVYPSLEGSGVITVKKVKVMGLKMFNDMASNLGREKLSDPDLSKVEIKTTIKNNIITLDQTKMKISGFRLKIKGETSFDGKLNLKTRVGLPPLGIVGIPIRILGTQENPKFKYGRGNNDEALEETEYSDEIPQEFLDKVKNVKEEDDDGNE